MPGVMVTSVPYQLKSAEPFVLERPGAEAEVAVPRSASLLPEPHPSALRPSSEQAGTGAENGRITARLRG
jgi:hypothetical protein